MTADDSEVSVFCVGYSTVLDKYSSTGAREVSLLRVQVSLTGVMMSYRSSLDEQSLRHVNVIVNVSRRAWTHVAIQV